MRKVSQVKSNGKRYDFKPLLETSEKRFVRKGLLIYQVLRAQKDQNGITMFTNGDASLKSRV